MYRGFFRFGSDVAARCDDDERVCLTVRVLEVEAAEEDGSGSYYALSEAQPLADLCNHSSAV